MKKSLWRFKSVFLLVFLSVGIGACASSSSHLKKDSVQSLGPIKLESVLLEALPPWAKDSLNTGSYLNIDAVMKDFNLTRLEAVDLQAAWLEALAGLQKTTPQDAFDLAYNKIKQGAGPSGFKPIHFANPWEYVVALDGDETLLMQWHGTGAAADFPMSDQTAPPDSAVVPSLGPGMVATSSANVKFTPGAEKFIRGLKADPHCKGIVFFSAKADVPAREIIRQWNFSGEEPASHFFTGVFTRSHLVLGSKATTLSKDLRVLDPDLKHVILVDDNPARVFQPALLRAQPKFDADRYHKALVEKDKAVVHYYEHLFDMTGQEIRETSEAAKRLKIPFSQAFIPYSYAGERLLRSSQLQMGSRKAALDFVRLHPELQDAAFVFHAVPMGPLSP